MHIIFDSRHYRLDVLVLQNAEYYTKMEFSYDQDPNSPWDPRSSTDQAKIKHSSQFQ